MLRSHVVELEGQGWEALSSGGEAARAFHERILDRTVVMLLPGGLVLDDRAVVVESMSGQPSSLTRLATRSTVRDLTFQRGMVGATVGFRVFPWTTGER